MFKAVLSLFRYNEMLQQVAVVSHHFIQAELFRSSFRFLTDILRSENKVM